jgi:hypothetical protein
MITRESCLGSTTSRLLTIAMCTMFAVGSACSQRQAPALATDPGEAQQKQYPAADLPPVSWTCPMHPEILEDEKSVCPICTMDLTPVRLDAIWSCPVHSIVVEPSAGKCPICRRELAQMTVALSFTCPESPDIDRIDPGTCPDGSATTAQHTPRAHGNHSPQHGGVFFMAADKWHHVEGAYPEEGVFRLFVYDDYSKPLPANRTTQITGRVITEAAFDTATRTEHELTAFELRTVENAPYLEARIDRLAPPAQMSVKVRFTADGDESRFDFAFPVLTKDPVGAAIPTAAVDPSQLVVEIPNDPKAVLAMLQMRNQQIEGFIEESAFAQIYVPAMQAKDLGIALEVQAATLPAARRAQVVPAVIELVRSAWLLDAYGDMGNQQQIAAAYATFASAVSKLESAFTTSAAGAPKR